MSEGPNPNQGFISKITDSISNWLKGAENRLLPDGTLQISVTAGNKLNWVFGIFAALLMALVLSILSLRININVWVILIVSIIVGLIVVYLAK